MVDSIQINSSNIASVREAAAAHAPTNKPSPLNSTASDTGTTQRVVFRGNQATYSEHAHASASDAVPVINDQAGKPVTAKSQFGRPLSGSEIDGKSIVNVGGFDTSVAAARAAGLVVERNGSLYFAGDTKSDFRAAADSANQGNHNEPAANTEQQEQQHQDAPAQQIELLDEASEASMSDIVAKVPDSEARSFSREMIETGNLSPEFIARAAERLGVSHEEAAQKAAGLHAAYTTQASRAVGPASEEMFSWARTAAPQELKAAINEQVTNGTTNGYKAIAARYMEQLATLHPNLLLESNATKALNVRRESDGKITVELPKLGRVEWRVAVRSGLLGNVHFTSNPFVKR